ncbi:MAG: FtsW/RodA/SpoVE family cell cycle protein [Lachnospiraceae bacterium]|nr:FtsW/RodA/SpoVE family cell cycle protein [Lachnospiraceae bacterium]
MIYSASSYRAEYYYGDSKLYFRRQGLFIVLGVLVMVAVSLVDYRVYLKRIKFIKIRPITILALICFALHAYALLNGHESGGSKRWIELGGGINLQPSELSKVCFVLLAAFLAGKRKRFLNTGNFFKNLFGFVFLFLFFVPILGIVAYQNLSSAIILAGIVTIIFFCVSMDKKYFIVIAALMIGAVVLLIALKGYRSERIMHFLYPESMDPGDQILQGLYAIASGGLFGKGLGNSVQKLGNIPEVHTDMIFTIICEELGIIGGIALIGLFLLLLWRIFKIALNAPDIYGALIATGVLAQLSIQMIMNVAVVTNSIPATGVPLPFVSYGGSSLLIMMAEIGIVLNVSKRTRDDIEDEDFAEET